jgi:hypothetical protein
VVAQELHDSAWREQVSPTAHGGQAGAPGGHLTHRLNIRRRFSSTSLPDTIVCEAIVEQLDCASMVFNRRGLYGSTPIVTLNVFEGFRNASKASDELAESRALT